MSVAGGADTTAGRRFDEAGLNAPQQHRRVHHRDNDAALGPANPAQLEEEPVQVSDVIEDQAAADPVEGRASQRQRLGQVMADKGHRSGARLGPGAFQHRPGEVNRSDARTGGCPPKGVPAGFATDVSPPPTRPPPRPGDRAAVPPARPWGYLRRHTPPPTGHNRLGLGQLPC